MDYQISSTMTGTAYLDGKRPAAMPPAHSQGHIQVQIKPEYPDTNTTNFPDPITGYGYEYHKFPGPDNRIRIIKSIRSDQISTKKASEYFGYPKKKPETWSKEPDNPGMGGGVIRASLRAFFRVSPGALRVSPGLSGSLRVSPGLPPAGPERGPERPGETRRG